MAIPLPFTLLIANLLLFSSQIASESDTLTQFQSLSDGTTTLVSKEGTFELGFFSPGSGTNRYLGIWFKNIPIKTVVWVANRDNAINNNTTSTMLTITKEGNLVLLSNNTTLHWSTNAITKSVNAVAQLLDTGNLVIRDGKDNNSQNYLWQSFDHPTDTLLPGMKIGWESKTGLNRYLTSWNNWEDPSSGNFSHGIDRSYNIPEMQLLNVSSVFYRTDPWSGFRFSATPLLKRCPLVIINFVDTAEESYYQFFPRNRSLIMRTVVNQTVFAFQRFLWVEQTQTWKLDLNIPRDDFCLYNHCGSFGLCTVKDNSLSVCKCLPGFEQESPQGCVDSSKSWRCMKNNNDGFVTITNMKIPDTRTSWRNRSMSIEECKAKCWGNCSCTAYANSDITESGSGFSGCILWFGDLLDLRQFPDGGGQDLYVRVDISKIDKDGSRIRVIVISSIVSSIIAMLVVFTFFYWRSKTKFGGKEIMKTKARINVSQEEDLELPLFDFDTIACATSDFSSDNKLGQGGFGPVYRGMLPDGQNIAVKRLSDTSTQGLNEFKNEVIFCSKLQHRNLVKVLGYCIEEKEKLLIYEYMPNKSLDFFLFDTSQSKLLDWSKRLNIISGIARGLMYLHQDSRLRIIHRDLKLSNVLLDNDMNPKVSDFGLARMCSGDQIEGNTSRVVGTYGYMAPEYAIGGVFSIKSDVYSFGVILLEVLSGKSSKGVSFSNHNYNLIAHAWRCWKKCTPMEFVDTCLRDSYVLSEALRCIHIGLLCVQHQSSDRPSMTSVVTMLTSESALPQPKKPLYLLESVLDEEDSGQNMYNPTNEVTI